MQLTPLPEAEADLALLLWNTLQQADYIGIKISRDFHSTDFIVNIAVPGEPTQTIPHRSVADALFRFLYGDIPDGSHRCSFCSRVKKLTEFGRLSNNSHSRPNSNPMGWRCRECERTRVNEWYARRGKLMRAQRRLSLNGDCRPR